MCCGFTDPEASPQMNMQPDLSIKSCFLICLKMYFLVKNLKGDQKVKK